MRIKVAVFELTLANDKRHYDPRRSFDLPSRFVEASPRGGNTTSTMTSVAVGQWVLLAITPMSSCSNQ